MRFKYYYEYIDWLGLKTILKIIFEKIFKSVNINHIIWQQNFFDSLTYGTFFYLFELKGQVKLIRNINLISLIE